jgi:arylsulfatase A-like enzyme
VIVVMTDDQNDSMEGLSRTVGLLGSQGTTFRNSYVSFPLCCPSRATFLTGQYAHNHGVVTTELPNGYNGLNHLNTLPVWLRRTGYRTAMVGKYLNGYGFNDGIAEPLPDAREIPPGWAEWYSLTAGQDQRRYGYKLNENGKVRRYGFAGRDYVTDVLASKALTFIKRRAPRPKPFFLWFNPTAPHGESQNNPATGRDPTPAPRHLGLLGNAQAPRNPNFDEADVSDKPEPIASTPPLTEAEIEEVDRRHRGRVESLYAVDEAVARIVGKLRRAQDLRKTYIFFTSDNGLLLGAHRLLFKDYLYEEALRVPLIVRGPRFPRGAVRDQLVSNVDLAPTIAELARATPGLAMDGRSLLPAAADPSAGAGRELLFENRLNGDTAALHSGDWVYIDNGADELPELYDLAADPFQLESLHGSPAHAALMAQLDARLQQIRTCAGGACP